MSIHTECFFMVPKELHNTDMSLSELYLYSRMLDDYDFYISKGWDYAPSNAYLAGLIQSQRAQTAGDVIRKLERRGLVVYTGSQLGGRNIYDVIHYSKVDNLMTLPSFEERRNIAKENKRHLSKRVYYFNENREMPERRTLDATTGIVNMSNDSHISTILKSDDDIEQRKNNKDNSIKKEVIKPHDISILSSQSSPADDRSLNEPNPNELPNPPRQWLINYCNKHKGNNGEAITLPTLKLIYYKEQLRSLSFN